VKFEVLVEVRLRPGIADPQGATIERALPALGFDGVDAVRVGKAIRVQVDASDEADARRRVTDMTDRLLANPVIEESEILSVAPHDSARVAGHRAGAR
jgi:phosphoribosylformylglycinamidine synthase subunit PurS